LTEALLAISESNDRGISHWSEVY